LSVRAALLGEFAIEQRAEPFGMRQVGDNVSAEHDRVKRSASVGSNLGVFAIEAIRELFI
jgi:hypothetical protein